MFWQAANTQCLAHPAELQISLHLVPPTIRENRFFSHISLCILILTNLLLLYLKNVVFIEVTDILRVSRNCLMKFLIPIDIFLQISICTYLYIRGATTIFPEHNTRRK